MSPRIPLAFACSLLLLPACKSAAEHASAADAEVYDLVREQRAALGADDEFLLERPVDSLRAQILAGTYGAGEDAPPMLGLVECLEIAAEESRTFQDRREGLYAQGLALTLSRWTFAVQETGFVGATIAGTSDDMTSQTGFFDLGFLKLLESGALAVLDIGLDVTRLGTDSSAHSGSSASFSITQPILRGFGRDFVREPLTQAERELRYEARSFERFRRTFAFDVASRYFRLVEQMDTLENEQRNYHSLVSLRERNESFSEAGRLSDIQVDQARQDELRAENRVVDTRRFLAEQLDDFMLFLGLPPEANFVVDADELTAGEGVGMRAWDEEVAIAFALEHRLDHLTTVDRVEDAERFARVTADALRTGLDLDATVSAASDSGQPFDYNARNTTWSGGVTLDLPLDRLPERNAYRSSLIAIEAARRDLEQSEDEVKADLRAALRDVEAARRQVEIQDGAVGLAARRVESASLNLEAGRASTRDLLEAQASLLEAENARTSARIDLALARVALDRDLELLRVDEHGLRTLEVTDTNPTEEVDE